MIHGLLASIHWDVSPIIFEIPLSFLPASLGLDSLKVRWYGVLFASGFIIGQYLMARIYKSEGKPIADIDALTIYVVVGTIVGARLGHCLFYDPVQYLSDPVSILRIWEGGLASHGAAIGILLSIYLYSSKRPDQPMLWVLDRLVIFVCLGGMFIRLGNLMNSEIYGIETSLPWGFVFENDPRSGGVPRHPTQIYEALWCLLMFTGLYGYYQRMQSNLKNGSIFGVFLIVLFAFRFFVEFLKVAQISEQELDERFFYSLLSINTGQALSLPMIGLGIYVLYRVRNGGFDTLSKKTNPSAAVAKKGKR